MMIFQQIVKKLFSRLYSNMSWYVQYVGQNEMLISVATFLFCFLSILKEQLKQEWKYHIDILWSVIYICDV